MARTINGMIDTLLSRNDTEVSLILGQRAPYDILVSGALRLVRAALNAVTTPVFGPKAGGPEEEELNDTVRGRLGVHLKGTGVKGDPLLNAWDFLSTATIDTLTGTFEDPNGPTAFLEKWAHDPVLLQNLRRGMTSSFGMPIEQLHSTLLDLSQQFEALDVANISKNFRADATRVEKWRSDSARSLRLLFEALQPFCGAELARAS